MLKKYNKSNFERAVTTGAKVLAGDIGVEVLFMGNQAMTDGKIITIPSLPDDIMLNQDQVQVTRGYYHHECCHVMFTDMPSYQSHAEELLKQGDVLERYVFNAVEDCWIEREWMKKYPGSRSMLSAVHQYVAKKIYKEMEADYNQYDKRYWNWSEIGVMAISWVSSRNKSYEGTYREMCMAFLTGEQKDMLDKWYEEIKQITSTPEAMILAHKIVEEMLEQDMQEALEERANNDPDLMEKLKNFDNLTEEERDKIAEDTAGYLDATSQRLDGELDMNEVLGLKPHDGKSGLMDHKPFSTAFDKVIDRLNYGSTDWKYSNVIFHRDYNDDGRSNFFHLLEKNRGELSVMQRKIERGFIAKSNVGWAGAKEHGKLDARRLTAAYNGHPNVFRHRIPTPDVSTAVQIIVDGSGSMFGERIRMASQTCIALVQLLDRIQAESEVILFNGIPFDDWSSVFLTDHYIEQHEVQLKELTGYSRVEPHRVFCPKRFDDRINTSMPYLGNMPEAVGGGTPLLDTMALVYPRLLDRTANRKVMMLITDGMPSEIHKCENMIKHIQQQGVTVVGIGIGGDHIGEFCERSIWVNEISELATSVVDDLAHMLLGERFNARNERRVA